MADVRYVVVDYSDEDYLEVGSTVGYFEFEYVQTGYVSSVVNGTADLTSAFSQTSVGIRAKITTADLFSTSTLSATVLKLKPAELTAFKNISLTASAGKIFGADISLSTTSTLTAEALRIRPGDIALSAFNTVVSAAGRIRPAVDLTASQATLTATALRIRPAVSIYQDPLAPTGIIVDSTHQTAIPGFYPPIGGDFTNNGLTNETPLAITDIAFWIKNNSAQVIWSSTTIDGYASSPYTGYVFSYTGSGFTLVSNYVTSYGSDLINNPTVTTTLTWSSGVLDAGWNHIYLHIRAGANELYINGQSQGAGSGSNPGAIQLSQPIILGAEQRITGDPGGSQRTYAYFNTSSDFEIAQFWAGRAALSPVAKPTAFYNTTSMSGSLGYYNLGADGHDGFNTTFDKVYFYSEFNYPYANDRLSTAGARPTQYGANFLSTTATSDQSFIPGWLARTATTFADEIIPYYPARFRLNAVMSEQKRATAAVSSDFTLTANGFSISFGTAILEPVVSLTALLSYIKPATTNLTCAGALSATPYDFTKAEANLAVLFTISADADVISSGVNLTLAAVNLIAVGTVIRSGIVVTTLFADVAVTATTNLLGYANISAQAILSATPYDFTKASVTVTAQTTFEAEGRLQQRTRGTVQMQSAFSLTAAVLRIRIQTANIQSAAALLVADGGALRRGNISMTAFDTVLSAGKIIEFLLENTIAVTEEQRLLYVALESTLLLVQMANGVNTITAETTDVVVPQEQGRLLAQFNMPTN